MDAIIDIEGSNFLEQETMSFFKSFFRSAIDYSEKRGRTLVLEELRRKSARELADLGFDSHLINQGLKAWPWRIEDADYLAELKELWEGGSNLKPQHDKQELVSKSAIDEKSNQVISTEDQPLDKVA